MRVQILGVLKPSTIALPFCGHSVPAGFPSPAQDFLEPSISLDELLQIKAPHVYLMRVLGDSMRDCGIFDGDVLVVDRSIDAASGDVVVVSLNQEPLVKRLVLDQDGGASLHSENSKYPPIVLKEGDELHLWGVVTTNLRFHRVAR
jgi:DNA polymerase V